MRKITKIIVHCTANRPGCKMTARDFLLHQKHTKLGYHYIIFEDGSVFKMNPVDVVANHCKNHNATSIGIAYVGGLDAKGICADTRTPAQRDALRQLLVCLLRKYPVPIYGHRHFNNGKVCPCFDADTEYKTLLQDISSINPVKPCPQLPPTIPPTL